jgi:hypothetical protein
VLKAYRRIIPLVGLLALTGRHAAAEISVNLLGRPGVTQPLLYQAAASPIASVILFPGGSGVITQIEGNFLLRVRNEFVSQGISVAVVDKPSDRDRDANQYRASPEAAADIAAVVVFLKQKAPVLVWLVGTSRGSVSAANGATRLGPSQVGGLVLTSSVWDGGMRLVPLASITVPTLIVHNRDDSCNESPPSGAEPALAVLTNAPAKDLVFVSGGIPRGNPCGAMSAHGYCGIENQVVPVVITWIKRHSQATR